MKYDELAFVNQQLSGMLKSGIPLEGALRQLCATMTRGPLRDELQKLEAGLAQGAPLDEALAARKLPPLYAAMVRVGVQSNDLPGVLTLVADYYQRLEFIWTRLKGLMIYPVVVLCAALGVSLFLATVYYSLGQTFIPLIDHQQLFNSPKETFSETAFVVGLLLPVVVLGTAAAGLLLAVVSRRGRQFIFWRLPGFREAHLSRFASSMAMMLNGGTSVDQAMTLFGELEKNSALGGEVALWRSRLAGGHASFSEAVSGSRFLPPLFVWLVAGEREDWAAGFRRAAEIYHARAAHRIDMLLHAVLPVSIVLLAAMIAAQVYSLVRLFVGPAGALMDMGMM